MATASAVPEREPVTRRATVAAVAALAAVGGASRLPGLRDLPIFGDEAIFLRIARVVRAEPLTQLWRPLDAPSAPLHSWLLALFLPLSSDPTRAGRLFSVLCGALLVAALAWTVRRAGSAFSERDPAASAIAAVATAVLLVASPFFAFSDRLARVDALFALEVALCAGLSVELASKARRGDPTFAAAVLLGASMGLTMLTRQAVSYPLWLLAPIAFALGDRDRGARRRFAQAQAVAAGVALVLWLPMLVAPAWPDLATRIFHLATARPPLGAIERLDLVVRNLGLAVRSFWTYLTPPVLVAALAAAVWLFLSGRRRLFAYLAAWELLLLLPPVLFAGDFFPRYVLPAALPLLAAAGFALAALWTRAKVEAAALVLALAAWGAVDVFRGERDWTKWRLLPIDRTQFVSGWSAGTASERAVEFLRARGAERPTTVIVPQISGNPSDAVWLLLEGQPGIELFYAVDFLKLPILAPALKPDAILLRRDVWRGALPEPVFLHPASYVFFVGPEPVFVGLEGWRPFAEVVAARNPEARFVARYDNPGNERGEVESAVVIYRLR